MPAVSFAALRYELEMTDTSVENSKTHGAEKMCPRCRKGNGKPLERYIFIYIYRSILKSEFQKLKKTYGVMMR